jgi:methanogenic corrinoid protein MtbC1
MHLGHAPTYNLRAVIRATGVAADTLRAWERRYGLPMPQRTRGGHRLYSEWDIHVIQWLVSRQSEGLSISRAVSRWNDLIAAGTDPLTGSSGPTLPPPAAPAPGPSHIDILRAEWLQACLAYDEAAAESALNQAFGTFPAEAVLTGVLQASLHEIGEMWLRGQATVQQEHFMSALCMRRLDALIEATSPASNRETIVLACPESELHVLPLLFLHALLSRAGRRAVFLGADVPMAQLESTVRDVRPTLVVMAAQQLATASALKRAAALLYSLGVACAFGGRVFDVVPELRGEVAGSYLGPEIKTAVNAIDDILRGARPPARRVRNRRDRTGERFREMEPRIEANVQKHFARGAMPMRHLVTANRFLGLALGAALDFGDVKYLEADIEWVRVLLRGRGFPEAGLRAYLFAYAHGVRRVLGGEAGAIAGWLEEYAGAI